jgi:hypothetical protein
VHKHVRKAKKLISEDYRSLARDIMWILSTTFAILSYVSDNRIFMLSNFGTYVTEIVDDFVIAMIVLAAVLYLKSLRRR